MNLGRELARRQRIRWAVLGGITLICAGALWWFSDDGGLGEAKAKAEEERRALDGPVVLDKRIREQEEANRHLRDTIETLKAGCGFKLAEEYKVPAGHPQPGQYFNERMLAVQDRLRAKASERRVQYQERLGFERTAKVPTAAETPYLLAMLQVTDKAGGVILDIPESAKIPPVERFAITQPVRSADLTGAAGRPPLLREYVLRIELRAQLRTILWVLHRLAHVENEKDDYPLILRNLKIDGRNFQETAEVQSLDAVIEVAAMQFLTPEERAAVGRIARPGAGLKPGIR